jgi:hypothetical protein
MAIDKERSDKLVITMTDVHLPSAHRHCRSSRLSQRLKLNFDEDDYFIGVDWTRKS